MVLNSYLLTPLKGVIFLSKVTLFGEPASIDFTTPLKSTPYLSLSCTFIISPGRINAPCIPVLKLTTSF